MPKNWSDEYLCSFEPSERDRCLCELAKRYHEVTEAYDRTVCTGPIRDGSILPANPDEMVLINRPCAKGA